MRSWFSLRTRPEPISSTIVLLHERRVQIGLLTPEEGVARGLQQQCIACFRLGFRWILQPSRRQPWRLATSCQW